MGMFKNIFSGVLKAAGASGIPFISQAGNIGSAIFDFAAKRKGKKEQGKLAEAANKMAQDFANTGKLVSDQDKANLQITYGSASEKFMGYLKKFWFIPAGLIVLFVGYKFMQKK